MPTAQPAPAIAPVRAATPAASSPPPAAVPPPESKAGVAPTPMPSTASADGGARAAAAKPTPGEVQLTQRVLADVQRQVELMLEVRLREALAPVLARATDTLVRDARKELTAAMRDIVARAIAKELGKSEDR